MSNNRIKRILVIPLSRHIGHMKCEHCIIMQSGHLNDSAHNSESNDKSVLESYTIIRIVQNRGHRSVLVYNIP